MRNVPLEEEGRDEVRSTEVEKEKRVEDFVKLVRQSSGRNEVTIEVTRHRRECT